MSDKPSHLEIWWFGKWLIFTGPKADAVWFMIITLPFFIGLCIGLAIGFGVTK